MPTPELYQIRMSIFLPLENKSQNLTIALKANEILKANLAESNEA